MDQRLVERIEQARRELRIAEGVASEQELQAAALHQQMEMFRKQVHEALDSVASYLLGMKFARDEDGLVARLTADRVGFELRQSDSSNLVLRQSESKRVLLSIVAGDPHSANRIVCAIADCLAAPKPTA